MTNAPRDERLGAKMIGGHSAIRLRRSHHQAEQVDQSSFEALTRRASLTTLSLAGLAALARPAAVGAQTNGNPYKRCKQQLDVCKGIAADQCQGDPTTCPAQIACCDHLKRCKFGAFLTCLVATAPS